MKATSVVLLALFCIATLGCASATEERRAAATAPAANVTGQWSGTVGSGGTPLPVSLALDQKGANVTGNGTGAPHPEPSRPGNRARQGEPPKVSLPTHTVADPPGR